MPGRLLMLQRRPEFLRIRNGLRWSAPTFVVEAKSREGWQSPIPIDPAAVRFGLTVTKQLGGAVLRNRIRRRFKAALQQITDEVARPGFDYVVIARPGSAEQPFAALIDDLRSAVRGVHSQRPRKPRPDSGRPPRPSDRKS